MRNGFYPELRSRKKRLAHGKQAEILFFTILNFPEGHFVAIHKILWIRNGQALIYIKEKLDRIANILDTAFRETFGEILEKSDYIITLKGTTREGKIENISDYSFTIDRK